MIAKLVLRLDYETRRNVVRHDFELSLTSGWPWLVIGAVVAALLCWWIA